MKKILVLGAGVMQVPVIQKIKVMGHIPIVVDYDPQAPGFVYSTNNYLTSTLDYEGVLKIAKDEEVDGILTTSDAPVRIVARVAKVLGLKAMSEEVADICTNKLRQRCLFKRYNVGAPYFDIIDKNNRDINFNLFPCIVKPIDSSASRGVSIAQVQSDLKYCIDFAFKYSKSDKILIEQFVGGREFSVETFTQDGQTTVVAITEKHLLDNGYFVENVHIEPALVSENENNLIQQEVIKAIASIGLDNAPTHTEVKLWNGKVYIIEIACRLGGDYITADLVPLSTGVDMLANLIRLAIGDNIDVSRKWNKYAAIQFVNNTNYSACKSYIENNSHTIVRCEILPYSSNLIRNSLDRLGYIIIEGNNRNYIDMELNKMQGNEE